MCPSAGLQGYWSVVLYSDSTTPYCSFTASIKIAAQYSAGAEITGTVTMSDVINKGQKFVLEGEASNYEGTLEEIVLSFSMTNDEKIYLEAEFGDSDLKSSGGGLTHVTANETTRHDTWNQPFNDKEIIVDIKKIILTFY